MNINFKNILKLSQNQLIISFIGAFRRGKNGPPAPQKSANEEQLVSDASLEKDS